MTPTEGEDAGMKMREILAEVISLSMVDTAMRVLADVADADVIPVRLVKAAMLLALNMGREEAGKVCDVIGKDWRDGDQMKKSYAAEYLAKQIRALQSPTSTEKRE